MAGVRAAKRAQCDGQNSEKRRAKQRMKSGCKLCREEERLLVCFTTTTIIGATSVEASATKANADGWTADLGGKGSGRSSAPAHTKAGKLRKRN